MHLLSWCFYCLTQDISFDNMPNAVELFEIYGFLKSNFSFVLMAGFRFFSPSTNIIMSEAYIGFEFLFL